MSKLRNHSGDVAVGLAQWTGRKIRHHNPAEEVVSLRTVKSGRSLSRKIGINATDPLQVIYLTEKGQRFAITVRELDAAEPTPAMVAVGI